MVILLKKILSFVTFLLLPVIVSGQSRLALDNKNFNMLIVDKGWSFFDSTSDMKDIVVIRIGTDSSTFTYVNFIEGIYSITYKTDIKISDNSFRITVTQKGKEPFTLATGFLETNTLMVLTLSKNPIPGIKSMFNKGLTLRLEEVKEEEK